MTGSVNGQNGNQQFIKLYNGKTFDLKNLDKLIGQSSEGSVFASFDGVNNGGNANNVFDEAEINSIKAQIMSYQTNDGVINQDELNKMFGYEGIVDENNNPKNFDSNKLATLFDVLSQEIDEKQVKEEKPNSKSSTEEPEPKQYETVTKYVVQAGDSPLKIAKRLGYTGEEAKAYAKELTEKLKNDGAINKRGWLTAGQQIGIIGDHQETLAASADYTEDKTEINQRFASMAPARPRKSRQAKIPASVTARAEQIKKDGGKCQIVQNEDGSYSIIQTSGGNYMKNHKIASIELGFDKNGIFKTQTNTLTNGKAIDGKMQGGKMVWGKAYDPKLRKERAADKTSSKNRVNINTVRNQAKADAAALKTQINGASLNDNTRKMLNTKIQNQDIAYILEAYPNLVKDIYDEWGMGNNDVQKYVVNKLNSRLRELGMNKYCLPADTSKMKPADLQKACNNIAAFIRKTDAQTGYVFKPNKGDAGKVNYARLESQKGARVYTEPPKADEKQDKNTSSDTKNDNKNNEVTLRDGEELYPQEMQKFILEERAKGNEYIVKKQGREYILELDYYKSKPKTLSDYTNYPTTFDINLNNLSLQPKPIKFKVDIPFKIENQMTALKALGTEIELKELENGMFILEQTNNLPNGVKSLTTHYDNNGDFQYELKSSSENNSVQIGYYNSKLGIIQYQAFKNEKGFLVNIPDKVKQKADEMNMDGGSARLYKGYNTVGIVQTKGAYLTQNGIKKIEHKYNPFGVLIEQVYTYENGRVEKYYDASLKKNDAAHAVNPIKISLPEQYLGADSDNTSMIYGLEINGAKNTAQRFAAALENNKAHLMTTLNLTNEEYDNLAILAMGIAEQETHFGQDDYIDTQGDEHSQDLIYNRAQRKYIANSFIWSEDEQAKHSQGITQINYSRVTKDQVIKKAFRANGINSFNDLLKSPEKQAIATMIILKQNKNIAEGKTWQARLQKNNAQIKDPSKKLTTNDVIALLWNGAGGVSQRMADGEVITIDSQIIEKDGKELKGAFYAKAVRTYADRFFASPATLKSGAMHSTNNSNIAGALGATTQGNGGQLGEVVFMPKSYSNAWRTASTKEQNKNANNFIMQNKNLSPENKQLILNYINNGLIGFGNQGLTQEEALSITNNDIELLTEQVNAISTGKSPNQANKDFETNYLRSREFRVDINSVTNKNSILSSVRSNNPIDEKISNDLNFKINNAFLAGSRGKGTARYTSFNNNSNENVFAITRSKGVNPYLANGTKVDDKYRVAAEHAHYIATNQMETSGRCKTSITVDLEYSMGIAHQKIRGYDGRTIPHAKQLTEFYNAHPEVFSQIKYIDNGDGTARELNAADISNLPCGLWGVFTPGKGFENESGHAFVTDGFGEANADEHDNGKWAHFRNGKGEHGKLEVYGFTDNVISVYSEKLGRMVNVPLDMNPWYLVPEFRELQNQERIKRGLEPLEIKEEFTI